MGIRKRGDKWLVTVELGPDDLGYRRRVCRTAESEEEAKRILARLQHDVYEDRHIKPSQETVPVFCRRYLADHSASVAPATRLRYEAYMPRIERDLGRITLARFTPKVAVTWKASLLAAGLAPSTVRKYLVFVSAAMKRAVSWKLIGENPLEHVELPSEEPPAFHVFTPSEQAALLAAAAPSDGDPSDRWRGRSAGAMLEGIALAIGSGLRRGELIGLRIGDLDLAHNRLHVRQAVRRTAHGEDYGPCKTKRSRRTVVISSSLSEMLAGYIERRGPVKTDLLFLTLDGRPWTGNGFQSSWRKVRARAADIMRADAKKLGDPHWEDAGAGIESGRFHDIRHTHATELLRAAVHIKVVAERLGDSELTVMRIYSHVLPDMQEAAAAAIEPMMRGLLPQRGR
jgi:integrase